VNFKGCARLASLADGANGALTLRVPGYSAGGPHILVMLPALESGAARDCIQLKARSVVLAATRPALTSETTAHRSFPCSSDYTGGQRSAGGEGLSAHRLTDSSPRRRVERLHRSPRMSPRRTPLALAALWVSFAPARPASLARTSGATA
jgi:hypothetical protein